MADHTEEGVVEVEETRGPWGPDEKDGTELVETPSPISLSPQRTPSPLRLPRVGGTTDEQPNSLDSSVADAVAERSTSKKRERTPLVHLKLCTWGHGSRGELGLSTMTSGGTLAPPTMVEVESLRGRSLRSVSCGKFFTAILTAGSGEVYTFGDLHGRDGTPLGPRVVSQLRGEPVATVACGSVHIVALTEAGFVYSWGSGIYGRLGHGNDVSCEEPRLVEIFSRKGTIARCVACGDAHTALVTNDGQLWTWGLGEDGQLGHGAMYDGRCLNQLIPRIVECSLLRGKRVAQVSCGHRYTALLLDTGEVLTFGNGKNGQLGHGNTETQVSPKVVEVLRTVAVRQISCGGKHMAILTDEGDVYTCGAGSSGQLGHGNENDVWTPTLVRLLCGKSPRLVDCGFTHTAVVTDDGRVFTCGNNNFGQCGLQVDAAASDILCPSLIDVLALHHVTSVSCGAGHTAAIVASGVDEARTIFLDLLQSERKYVRTLNILWKDYYMLLFGMSSVIARDDLDVIFSNLEEILTLNRKFLRDLDRMVDSGRHPFWVGETFLQQSGFLPAYSEYGKRFVTSQHRLRSMLRENQGFVKFLAKRRAHLRDRSIFLMDEENENWTLVEADKEPRNNLRALLREPVGRIAYYGECFERLLSLASPGVPAPPKMISASARWRWTFNMQQLSGVSAEHTEASALAKCVVNLSTQGRDMQKSVDQADNESRFESLRERFPNVLEDMLHPSRVHVKDGKVTEILGPFALSTTSSTPTEPTSDANKRTGHRIWTWGRGSPTDSNTTADGDMKPLVGSGNNTRRFSLDRERKERKKTPHTCIRTLLLFHDVVVLLGKSKRDYTYQLGNVWIRDVCDSDVQSVFQLVTPETTHTLVCPTQEIKKSWLDRLDRCIRRELRTVTEEWATELLTGIFPRSKQTHDEDPENGSSDESGRQAHNAASGALSGSSPVVDDWYDRHYVNRVGSYKFADGRSYEGEWHGGHCHGLGRMHYADGSIYEGMYIENMREGEGRFTSSTEVYEGYWKGDRRHGEGSWRSGDNEYLGPWKDGQMDGKGSYTWANGDLYFGNWKEGKREGIGRMLYNSGGVYEGMWVDNRREGKGVFITRTDKYEGMWLRDKRHGEGTWSSLVDGSSYHGNWVNDTKEGRGMMVYPNQDKFDGNWKKDKPHGSGVLTSSDNMRFEGEWANGVRSGRGTLVLSNGDTITGEWSEGGSGNTNRVLIRAGVYMRKEKAQRSEKWVNLFGGVNYDETERIVKRLDEEWLEKSRDTLDLPDTILKHANDILSISSHPLGRMASEFVEWFQVTYAAVNPRPQVQLLGALDDVKSFISFLHENFLRIYPPLDTSTRRWTAREAVREVVVARTYDQLFGLYTTVNKDKDTAFYEKCQQLRSKSFSDMGIRKKFWLIPEHGFRPLFQRRSTLEKPTTAPYHEAIDILRLLPQYQTPCTKLNCIVEAFRSIQRTVEKAIGGDVFLGADDLIPILCYVVVQASVPTMHTQSLFLDDFSDEISTRGEAGCCLANLDIVIAYLFDTEGATTTEKSKG